MADEGVVAGDEPLGATYLEGAPATGVPSAPQATFAPGTPKRVIGWSTLIIVVAFGLTVLGVVAGALWLAGQDKALPGEIIALASMALTFMGKAIVDEVQP
jgi:hypothetical protein